MFRPLTNDLYAGNLAKYGPEDSRTILEPAELAGPRRHMALSVIFPYHEFLDLGCGPGVFARELLNQRPVVYYHGVDAVEEFITTAKNMHGPETRVSFGTAGYVGFEHHELSTYAPPRKMECVLALGVMSDLQPDKLDEFAALLCGMATDAVVVSFHDSRRYAGKLATAFLPADVYAAFTRAGWPSIDTFDPSGRDSLLIIEAKR